MDETSNPDDVRCLDANYLKHIKDYYNKILSENIKIRPRRNIGLLSVLPDDVIINIINKSKLDCLKLGFLHKYFCYLICKYYNNNSSTLYLVNTFDIYNTCKIFEKFTADVEIAKINALINMPKPLKINNLYISAINYIGFSDYIRCKNLKISYCFINIYDIKKIAELKIKTLVIKNCDVCHETLNNINLNTSTLSSTSSTLDTSTLSSISSTIVFSNVTYLEFINNSWVTNLSTITKNTMQNLKTLHIINCPIENVDTLGFLECLYIINCNIITCVSKLSTVSKVLDLTDCIKIRNVSTLGNIPILILNGCIMVSDVSKLINNTELYLKFCVDVVDVSNQYKVRILNIEGTSVKDIRMLRDVKVIHANNDLNIKGLKSRIARDKANRSLYIYDNIY